MQPRPRHVPVEAGAPPNCQRTAAENDAHDVRISPMLDREHIRRLVQRALDEDLPDITAEAIFEPGDRGKAEFVIKAPGVIPGLEFAELTFAILDSSAPFTAPVEDGAAVKPGDGVAEVSASVIALLSGERTALNFLQRASGIATMTRRYVDAVNGTN